jgi:hypothetical protein
MNVFSYAAKVWVTTLILGSIITVFILTPIWGINYDDPSAVSTSIYWRDLRLLIFLSTLFSFFPFIIFGMITSYLLENKWRDFEKNQIKLITIFITIIAEVPGLALAYSASSDYLEFFKIILPYLLIGSFSSFLYQWETDEK